jgi:hypothetical protein
MTNNAHLKESGAQIPAHWAVPEALKAVLAADQSPQPQPGQMWRLEWAGTAATVVLMDVRGYDIDVVPVAFDPEYADEYTLLIPADLSPIQIPLALWVALRTKVRKEILDRYLGNIDRLDDIDQLYRAFLAGHAVCQTLGIGAPISSPADVRWQYRDHLVSMLAKLADIRWAFTSEPDLEDPPTLGALVHAAGISSREVADVLDMDAPEVSELLAGNRDFDHEQARHLARLLGQPVQAVLAARPRLPGGLLSLLATPRWRAVIRNQARETGRSETELRYETAWQVKQMAARITGASPAGGHDWERLLREQFDTQG